MMDRIDLFHLPFYKKEAFTGSDRGIRFWDRQSDSGRGRSGAGLSACNRLAGAHMHGSIRRTNRRSVKILRFQKKDWMKSMSGFWGMEEN